MSGDRLTIAGKLSLSTPRSNRNCTFGASMSSTWFVNSCATKVTINFRLWHFQKLLQDAPSPFSPHSLPPIPGQAWHSKIFHTIHFILHSTASVPRISTPRFITANWTSHNGQLLFLTSGVSVTSVTLKVPVPLHTRHEGDLLLDAVGLLITLADVSQDKVRVWVAIGLHKAG
jgi:hypothetical protein